jgi:hypothetical protein
MLTQTPLWAQCSGTLFEVLDRLPTRNEMLFLTARWQTAVDVIKTCMHAFNQCQQALQATANARIGEKQAVAQQLCLHAHARFMRATRAMRVCWGHVLKHNRRMAAGYDCTLPSQTHAQLHAACARVFSTALVSAVAVNGSNAPNGLLPGVDAVTTPSQLQKSEEASLPQLFSCVPQAEQTTNADTYSQVQSRAGIVDAERETNSHPLATAGAGASDQSAEVRTQPLEKSAQRLSSKFVLP